MYLHKYTPELCKLPNPSIKINNLYDINKYYDKWLKEHELDTIQNIDIKDLHYILGNINDRDDFIYNIKCINNKFLDIECNNGIFEPKCVEHRLKGGKKTKKKKKKKRKRKLKGNKKRVIK